MKLFTIELPVQHNCYARNNGSNNSNNNNAQLYNSNNNSCNNNINNNNLLQLIKWQTDDNEGTTRCDSERCGPSRCTKCPAKDPVQEASSNSISHMLTVIIIIINIIVIFIIVAVCRRLSGKYDNWNIFYSVQSDDSLADFSKVFRIDLWLHIGYNWVSAQAPPSPGFM